MASRLVPIKSVEEFRALLACRLARYVWKTYNEEAAPQWRHIKDDKLQEIVAKGEFMYYVEEDE